MTSMNNDQLKKVAIEALETCAIGANGFTKTYWFDEQKVKAAIAALTAAQSASLAKVEREPVQCDLRMDAYYYGFDQTGVPAIDRILSAVACAGKAHHHTEDWGYTTTPYTGHVGNCAQEWIQNAANDAAKLYAAAPQIHQESKTYTRAEVQQWRDDVAHAAADMVKRADTNGEWTWLVDSIRALAANPQAQQEAGKDADSFAILMAEAIAEAEKAMRKFPQPNYTLLKVAEEAGEVVKAGVHFAEGRDTAAHVRDEMKQTIAMLYRLWKEGDQRNGVPAIDAAMKASTAQAEQSKCAYERDDGSNCDCGWPGRVCKGLLAEQPTPPTIGEHQSWCCSEGCGKCRPVQTDFEYSRTETRDGQLIDRKTVKRWVSHCCKADLMLWDEDKQDFVDEVPVLAEQSKGGEG